MLEKHPDTMSDSELYQKIHSWVHTKTPESIFLDYKKELFFETQKQKIELGKDISSFANTKGGCLLYGIDEDRQSIDSAPIPKIEYGMVPINRQLIDIENILGSIISPTLPELRIRQVSLEHDTSKIVYLIWHPKSWVAPHMVNGFKNNKYYKRGNFKSEPMEEHEVDILYQA
ncbi:MAG: ATP-binding protein, partial [Proteobacteria bacterium]|nr:ATP-binding protein [Pseudomonadota bacterium]